jgi:hypothetical protein
MINEYKYQELGELQKHINIKTYKFDVDLEKVFFVPTVGPCFKTKGWGFIIPIYGNFEAIEIHPGEVSDELDILILDNIEESEETEQMLQFYRKEFASEIFKWNAKTTTITFKISPQDKEKYNV